MVDCDEKDPQDDLVSLLAAAALADHAVPPISEEVDADDGDHDCLTEADRKALDALGSTSDKVRRAIASGAPSGSSNVQSPGDSTRPDAVPSSEVGTCYASGDETRPQPGSRFWNDDVPPDLDQLMMRLESVQQAEQIQWTSCYRKLDELGRGGQGVVYLTKCLDELSGEQALKVYSPLPYGNAADYQEDMQRMQKVASEVFRIHHDNLVDVQRFVEYQGIYVMVMQWIDGFDLRRLLDLRLVDKLRQNVERDRWSCLDNVVYATPSPGRLCLQPLMAVDIVEKCLRGLSVLHDKGVVHGDIKPSNIMLDCNGSIRLIDIGSACSINTPPKEPFWTPRYTPPEFFEDGKWTPQSDLASLGYVLIELLSGEADLAGPSVGDQSTRTFDRRRDDPLWESKLNLPERLPELLPENVCRCESLMRLCQRLVDPDPTKRFATANAAIEGNGEGTWDFRRQVIRNGMGVHEASEIKRWVEDVKGVLSPFGAGRA